jgi:small GTP-binding protein
MSTPITVKVVLLGNSGVGKSSLALRFTADAFADEHDPTLGAAFMTKTMNFNDRKVKFNIWDTAGQERYRSMARMYYQDAQAAILVYDLTSKESFTELKNWYKELRENAPPQLGNR